MATWRWGNNKKRAGAKNRATWMWSKKKEPGQHGAGAKNRATWMWVPNKRARAQRAEATYSQGNMELGKKIGQHGCASKKKKREKKRARAQRAEAT